MDQILIYSDSLTWGIVPDTRERLTFDKRWPGVFEAQLARQGTNARVIENCLNGRRTVWDDPFKAGRNGSQGLQQVIEMNSPLKLVVLMLGTNDFQSTHNNDAWLSAQGCAELVTLIKTAPIEPGMSVPEILIVCPPQITRPNGVIANKFTGAEQRCVGLADALKDVAAQANVHFYDANKVVAASLIDGIHLDEAQHEELGLALADFVQCCVYDGASV